MSNNTSSNKAAVPEAKGALNRFKFEVANELGVPLTDGYNGNLTSKQNGSVGGYMVNAIFSERHRGNPRFSISPFLRWNANVALVLSDGSITILSNNSSTIVRFISSGATSLYFSNFILIFSN